jgi:antitoxin MazE
MDIAIRTIGHSKGVVLPKPVLAQAGLLDTDSAELTVEDDAIVLRRPSAPARTGWAEAAQAIAERGGDAELIW